jgi:hypothetical protein
MHGRGLFDSIDYQQIKVLKRLSAQSMCRMLKNRVNSLKFAARQRYFHRVFHRLVEIGDNHNVASSECFSSLAQNMRCVMYPPPPGSAPGYQVAHQFNEM